MEIELITKTGKRRYFPMQVALNLMRINAERKKARRDKGNGWELPDGSPVKFNGVAFVSISKQKQDGSTGVESGTGKRGNRKGKKSGG